MPEADIQKYAGVMKEIKLRVEVINKFLSGQLAAHYVPPTIETIGLQFRKIFELIAFASLTANREEYSKAYSDFEKDWEAAKLVKRLRLINPKFYPRPVEELPSQDPRAERQLQYRFGDYLTEQELVEAHGRCGSLMHAANPYGAPIQYDYFQKQFPTWRQRTMNLLNNHQVHLPGVPGFWLLHMQERGHNEVAYYRFAPPDKT
jgi:hypothetical protein